MMPYTSAETEYLETNLSEDVLETCDRLNAFLQHVNESNPDYQKALHSRLTHICSVIFGTWEEGRLSRL